jgi:hypothetical protein
MFFGYIPVPDRFAAASGCANRQRARKAHRHGHRLTANRRWTFTKKTAYSSYTQMLLAVRDYAIVRHSPECRLLVACTLQVQ